ncbi:pathogenesis-related protein 1A-like [Rutidosis leptorrhynchoides]|uniref:pathogenesis-related protein 1A-like n=1 Tax=Rutidosis leptorrhynchoides TaxID=125765 RepID=UPI003A993C63
MESLKLISFSLLITTISFLSLSINAQNIQQDYLNAHNSARRQVGVADIVWNATVAGYAQNYANQRIGDCNLVHSGVDSGLDSSCAIGIVADGKVGVVGLVSPKCITNFNSPYGENLAGSSGMITRTAAVNLWVAEKSYYDHTTNTCASGRVCGHYTQVVWRSSTQLGCARVQCANNRGSFVICNYYPRGNYIGQSPY